MQKIFFKSTRVLNKNSLYF